MILLGWCQPGENMPATLSAAGVPPEFQILELNKAHSLTAERLDTGAEWRVLKP